MPSYSDHVRVEPSTLSLTVQEHGPEAVVPQEGATVGRYLVIEELGRGGTGVVLRAYDPTLHREVALKLLHSDSISGTTRERIAREGQAMAQLSHPNVVAVYDVELGQNGVVLVMELVRGKTMTQWLGEERRPWRTIVEAFIQAGRGLAAAHQAGLLHRDFKPSNVLIGDDDRIRVTDFGLARLHGESDSSTSNDRCELAPDTDQLTQTGLIMGTPLYMPPEQYDRVQAVDERSDQYAFCVSLWYALVGSPPFERDTEGCTEAKRMGPPKWPRSVPLPHRIVRAIRRGLAPEREGRWPAMGELLAELERGRRDARSRRVWMAVCAVALLAATGEGYRRWDLARRAAECETRGSAIRTSWNEDTARQTRAAFAATGVGFAETTAAKVVGSLDDYATQWENARTRTCIRSEVEREWSADLAESARWCLQGRRLQFEALVEQLEDADDPVVHTAIKAVFGLPSAEPCADPAVLQRLPSPSSQQRENLQQVLAEMGRAEALRASGRYDEALQVAEAVLKSSDTIGWGPIRAQAQLLLGSLLADNAQYEAARAALIEAYFAAVHDAPEVAADASLRLVVVLGNSLNRIEDGEVWARFSEAAISRLEGASARRRQATLANSMGMLWSKAGRYREAKRSYESAVELWQQESTLDRLAVAASTQNLGLVQLNLGEYEAARASLERARDIFEATLGADHPDLAYALVTLGSLHKDLGEYDLARALTERALIIRERALGGDHPLVALTLNNIGSILQRVGDHDAAAGYYSRAQSIFERGLGTEHPDFATAVHNLGTVHLARGEYEEAKIAFSRALQILELALGPDHERMAAPLGTLARVHHKQGELDRARELYERSLAIKTQKLGSEHPDLVTAYQGLGDVAMSRGERRVAVEHYERAAAILREAFGDAHPRTQQAATKLKAASNP